LKFHSNEKPHSSLYSNFSMTTLIYSWNFHCFLLLLLYLTHFQAKTTFASKSHPKRKNISKKKRNNVHGTVGGKSGTFPTGWYNSNNKRLHYCSYTSTLFGCGKLRDVVMMLLTLMTIMIVIIMMVLVADVDGDDGSRQKYCTPVGRYIVKIKIGK